jgi:iron complex outermembrane receptor protein
MIAVARHSVLGTLTSLSFCTGQSLVSPPRSAAATADAPAVEQAAQDILDMDIEQLAQAEVVVPALDEAVSTVSRQESTVGRSAAAVFVITPEMIRRSGANNVPDVLRMVPGVEVARIDANKWAISIRGFNSLYSDKLLVQIDGRAVYTQFFSGVFWDAHDVMLEDVERIEVIRGPGATVWGANAVNGVINIITKQAKDTQGALVVGGAGTEQQAFSRVRYGGQVGDDLCWRVYGKQFENDGGFSPRDDFDDWRQGRGGFRADWNPCSLDLLTVEGDFYDGYSGELQTVAFSTDPYSRDLQFNNHVYGQDYLSRWTHTVDDDSDWAAQIYYQMVGRGSPVAQHEQETFDLDFQYRFPIGQRHEVICGAGYRQVDDHLFGSFAISMEPVYRNTDLFSYFVQDQITLEEDRWYFTAGSKFEHNDFSGFEYQPTVRLLHTPSNRQTLWASVSRAVRTPNRVNADGEYNQFLSPIGPTFGRLSGNREFRSEELLAWEIGYRAQPTDAFFWDLACFYNYYTRLVSVEQTGQGDWDPDISAVVVPFTFANSVSADTGGAELAATYQVKDNWELSGAYTLFYMDRHGPTGGLSPDSSAHNRLYAHSAWSLRPDLEFDLIGRYVDSLSHLGVPSYLTIDARIAWRINKHLEWAVVGRNLLDRHHLEFIDVEGGTIGTEVQSEVFTTLTCTR